MNVKLPPDETRRLEALRDYEVLDTPPEASFDDLTRLAAQICQTPIASISFITEKRQWFKSKVGIEANETPRDLTFCAHAILHEDQLLEVRDAQDDARFTDNPLVTGAPHIRFYAGAPLVTSQGDALGTLCVIDHVPRILNDQQRSALRTLSRQVVAQLELRRQAKALVGKNAEHKRAEDKLREQFVQLTQSEVEAKRLLALAEESRSALLSVLEDQQMAEAALRKNGSFIKDVINSLTAYYIVVLDGQGKIVEANQPWKNLVAENNAAAPALGYLGENYLTVCANNIEQTDNADAQAALHGIQDVMHGVKPNFSLEYPCHSSTEKRWYLMRVLPLTGTQSGVVVAHQNISEQKLAEIHIQKLNRVYAVLSDINQTIVRNPNPQTMFTAACRIAVEKGNFKLAWIGLLDAESKALKPVAQAGVDDGYVNKLNIVIKEGTEGDGPSATAIKTGRHSVCNDIEHNLLMAPWRAQAMRLGYHATAAFPLILRNQVIGVYNLYSSESDFFDNDELRLLDELAVDISFAVEVSQRETERLKLEEQLRQSQKMEAIGQLAGGVAHDFNNILAVIQMQAGLLRVERNLPPTQTDYASEIEKAAQRAANLTRQLLMFSRRQTLQPRNLDLNDIISHITKMLQRVLGEDIRIQIKYASQPLFINADAGMMDQILMNLTVNSRDAMPKGGQLIIETSAVEFNKLTAAQSTHARPGSFVCLSVSDTGSGIPLETLPRIFDPFFTTKDVGKGTGLGLATVFGIVQQHQGWINVHSIIGQGTTFRVYLPRLAHAAEKKTTPLSPESVRGGNETILVVEDDPALRAVVQNALSRLGYRVIEAPTGITAVNVWRQNRTEISLLLTDMVMPDGMNGKELAEQLQRENPKLKVIYTSGYSADIAGEDFPLEDGVNFLAKPFLIQKLAQTIRECLDKN